MSMMGSWYQGLLNAYSLVMCLSLRDIKMWSPDSKKVIQSSDVTFNENAMLSSGKESVISFAGIGD